MVKDYTNMTQEELEIELSKLIKKNYEKGIVLLDRDYKMCSLRTLTDIEKVENIDDIISILRAMKVNPNMKKHCKGMADKTPLINTVIKEHEWEEIVHEDFVSREEFINRTGIFVTPSHFDFIYNIEFKESGMSVDEFIQNFDENYIGEIVELPLKGTFRYMITDDDISCIGLHDEWIEPNIWDIVNYLSQSQAMESQSKWEYIEKYKKSLEDSVQMLTKLQAELRNTVVISDN